MTSLARPRRSALLSLLPLALALAAAPAGAQEKLLPLNALIDSAGLVRDVSALRLELPREMPPLFWLIFDSSGQVRRVEPMFERLPTAYADPVVAAIRARARMQPATPKPGGTMLRVIAGAEAVVDRPELRETEPRLLNGTEMANSLVRVMARIPRTRFLPGTSRQARLRFRLGTDGSADDSTVEVLETSGDHELDAEAVRLVRRMRFRPGRIEGIPVRVWVTLPLTFEMPSEGQPLTPAGES